MTLGFSQQEETVYLTAEGGATSGQRWSAAVADCSASRPQARERTKLFRLKQNEITEPQQRLGLWRYAVTERPALLGPFLRCRAGEKTVGTATQTGTKTGRKQLSVAVAQGPTSNDITPLLLTLSSSSSVSSQRPLSEMIRDSVHTAEMYPFPCEQIETKTHPYIHIYIYIYNVGG